VFWQLLNWPSFHTLQAQIQGTFVYSKCSRSRARFFLFATEPTNFVVFQFLLPEVTLSFSHFLHASRWHCYNNLGINNTPFCVHLSWTRSALRDTSSLNFVPSHTYNCYITMLYKYHEVMPRKTLQECGNEVTGKYFNLRHLKKWENRGQCVVYIVSLLALLHQGTRQVARTKKDKEFEKNFSRESSWKVAT